MIAEVFAFPEKEYIAFSEFPLGEGIVDFVLFTSRSRMEIKVIEVKGADFSFSNIDGSLSNKINLAAQQVRQRFRYIHGTYESFRRSVHDLRLSVESGSSVYNSYSGPNGFLHVDSHKDIGYSGVVIGGRTRDDTLESKLKMDVAWNSKPTVRLESWDSWLKKLMRA